MTFYILTFGCKVNQYDAQEIARVLAERGYTQVFTPKADVIIVNTCTVTAESDRKARSAARRLKHENPDGILVLTGCSPQASPLAYASFLEADIVVGNKSAFELADRLDAYLLTKERSFAVTEHKAKEALSGCGITDFTGHTRAFLKIQDGCDRFCSYCIIPTARGRSRSKSLEQIKSEAAALSKAGYREIVLVGIDLSDYGKGTPLDLADAVLAVSEQTGVCRVRLGSLEPDRLTDGLIDRLAILPKLCPHFHISLQSGSDAVLKAMNRHYTVSEYLNLCLKLRARFIDAALTTDVMTGFPGETPEDFLESLRVVRAAAFEKVHVFPYSRRAGTKAAAMPNHLINALKRERAALLAKAAQKLRNTAFEAQRGKTVEVLLETETDGFFEGYTPDYYPVRVPAAGLSRGELVWAVVTEISEEYLCGEPVVS